MGLNGLAWNVVPLAFGQGQDTRTQPKHVIPSKWRTLVNYSLSEDNTPRRRDGTQPLVSGATGNGLAKHMNELLVVNGTAVSTYSSAEATSTPLISRAGLLPNVFISKDQVRHSAGSADSMDCAIGISISGIPLTIYVWRDIAVSGTINGINCSVIDEQTGARVVDNVQLVADPLAICPRVVYDNNGGFFVTWLTTTVANRMFAAVVLTTGAVGTPVQILSDAKLVVKNFDACFFTGINLPQGNLQVYRWNDAAAGTASVRALRLDRTGTVPVLFGAPLDIILKAAIAVANIRGLTVRVFAGGVAGVFVIQDTGAPGLSGATITTNFAVGTAATGISAFAQVAAESHVTATPFTTGGDSMRVFCDQIGAVGTAAISPINAASVSNTLVPFSVSVLNNSASFSHVFGAGAANGPEGPWIAGKAFTHPDGIHTSLPCFTIEASLGTTLQNAFFLLDGTTTDGTSGRVTGKALYGSYGFRLGGLAVSSPCSTPETDVGNGPYFVVAVPELTQLLFSGGVPLTQVGVSRLTMTPNTMFSPSHAELGPVTFFSGGALSTYDASRVVEHGFNLFPENIGALMSAGGTVDVGTHQAVAVYEWVDSQGQRHQSSPSPAVSFTVVGGTQTLTVKVPTLLLSQKPDVTIAVYMTTAGGTTFFRSVNVFATTANSTSAAFISVVVLSSDAVLAAEEALYSQPDEGGTTLPNDSPPPAKSISVSQNRLWMLSGDNPLEYRFSQAPLNGFGLQFSGLFGDTTLGGLMPSESGRTVAIAPLDEKTIVLCSRKLYVIYGTGPDSSGANNNFSAPQEIPSDVGCADELSILGMPDGIMFRSEKGFHRINRDLSVTFIGDGATAYAGGGTTPLIASMKVMASTLVRDRKECRFEMQVQGDSTGVTLVYSYLFEPGQWSMFQRGPTASASVGVVSALWYELVGKYVWLVTTGSLQFDIDPVTFIDDLIGSAQAVAVVTVAQTAWLKVNALEGFQRVRRIYLTGTPISFPLSSSLAISVDYDDSDGASAPGSYTDVVPLGTVTAALTVGQPVDMRHKLRTQKCKSVSFTFTETPTVGVNASLLGIQALALEIGTKRGVNKLPAAQTV